MKLEVRMENEFFDIPGLAGYQINRSGQILSLPKQLVNARGSFITKPKILKTITSYQGYKMINLTMGGKGLHFTIHRLLAITFIPNPDNHPIINHIDGNKGNNDLANLEWCTHKHNSKHAIRIGMNRRANGVNAPKAKLQPSDIPEILKLKSDGLTYVAIGRKYGIAPGSVRAICTGKSWKEETIKYKTELV
jgi:hypothetical protein